MVKWLILVKLLIRFVDCYWLKKLAEKRFFYDLVLDTPIPCQSRGRLAGLALWRCLADYGKYPV